MKEVQNSEDGESFLPVLRAETIEDPVPVPESPCVRLDSFVAPLAGDWPRSAIRGSTAESRRGEKK